MNTGHGTRSQREALFAPEVYRTEEGEDRAPSEIEALRVELRNEVRALRTMITRQSGQQDFARELAALREALGEMTMAAAAPAKRGDKVQSFLKSKGIEGPAATRIAALVKGAKDADVAKKILEALAEVVPTAPWQDEFSGRRIVALVGPAGVGKTTTAAKLAARARMAGKSVTLVSCDGFRVGAVDQLERYSELLGAGFHVARTVADLVTVLEEETADLVFVDTSGRPPTATAPEAALVARRKKGAPVPVEVILCMSAATRAADAQNIAGTFGPVAPTSVCITKLDETVSPAGLVHAPFAAKKPVAILCNGPRVPEDIAPATPEGVASALGIEEGTK